MRRLRRRTRGVLTSSIRFRLRRRRGEGSGRRGITSREVVFGFKTASVDRSVYLCSVYRPRSSCEERKTLDLLALLPDLHLVSLSPPLSSSLPSSKFSSPAQRNSNYPPPPLSRSSAPSLVFPLPTPLSSPAAVPRSTPRARPWAPLHRLQHPPWTVHATRLDSRQASTPC